ncbi:hypothetical protein BDQ94DRAFT_56938 [Aspergillus welwitschiae]|uniref:Uncharacterized protein n=1 Tax=Aspergillus welwitschiae TaxID=1341132 RepID=A0A3F3PY04_9EURO|nr:hypothetical protein BDQ94DRAFT_56938 [Aspergillus welwitschiae]RDH31799.1 hypothetical protein BDQ94DRAFT_56938 [Aspergillus welwitschiae]
MSKLSEQMDTLGQNYWVLPPSPHLIPYLPTRNTPAKVNRMTSPTKPNNQEPKSTSIRIHIHPEPTTDNPMTKRLYKSTKMKSINTDYY